MLDWPQVRPVLEATYDLLEDRDHVDGTEVCEALAREPDDKATMRTLMLLRDGGWIEAYVAGGSTVALIQPTPQGLQRMRGWPKPGEVGPDAVDLLLALLDERIAASDNDEARGRWKRLRETVASVGQSMVAEALGAWAARMSGAAG